MEKKLAKLERRTQEAAHTLIRESCVHFVWRPLKPFTGQRLATQKGQSDDIIGAMKAQEQQQDLSDEED